MAFLHEHIILPLSDLLTGQHVHRHLQVLKRTHGWDVERWRRFQEERLGVLIQHASEHVPFYRDLFAHHEWDASNFKGMEDLSRLPIVSKEIMREEGEGRFMADNVPEPKRLWMRSSGSTGEPFGFYVSKEAYSANMATKIHAWQQVGYRMGDRYMKIANSRRSGMVKKVQDCLNRCSYIPFASLDNVSMDAILIQIEHEQPNFIRSYPSPLFLLARRRLEVGGYTHCPKHIMTTGALLAKNHRLVIEQAFGCDVIDAYSCEGTPNTYETEQHDGYHVSDYYGIIEVLDEAGNPVTSGVGRVISTDFWNMSHPFIRYDTQDLVHVVDGRIVGIVGRESECMLNVSGKYLTVHNFTHYFADNFPSVDAYQVVQHDGMITFRIVVNKQYTSETPQRIIGDWKEELGAEIAVEVVDKIPLMHNNKYLTILHED